MLLGKTETLMDWSVGRAVTVAVWTRTAPVAVAGGEKVAAAGERETETWAAAGAALTSVEPIWTLSAPARMVSPPVGAAIPKTKGG